MKNLSTPDVARQVGINRATLERWVASGNLQAPKMIQVGRDISRNWTLEDVKRVRKYKQENYRKGQGRKPKSKSKQ